MGDVAEQVRAAGDLPLPEVDERATREQRLTRGDELLDAVEHWLRAAGPDDDCSGQEERPEVVEPGGELRAGGECGEERPDDAFDLHDLEGPAALGLVSAFSACTRQSLVPGADASGQPWMSRWVCSGRFLEESPT